jgi:hypothetical protein
VNGLPLLTVSRDDGNDRDDCSDYPYIFIYARSFEHLLLDVTEVLSRCVLNINYTQFGTPYVPQTSGGSTL